MSIITVIGNRALISKSRKLGLRRYATTGGSLNVFLQRFEDCK